MIETTNIGGKLDYIKNNPAYYVLDLRTSKLLDCSGNLHMTAQINIKEI